MAYTNIDRPLDNFVTTTWSGNDVDGRTISNGEFKPDFLWMFHRNIAGSCPGVVYNSTIGAGTDSTAYGGNSTGKYNALFTSLNYNLAGGDFYRYGYLSGLTSTGFTCAAGNDPSGYQNYRHNQTGYNYVAWQWKANDGTTSSNTDGTITSTVQVNQDAGFSIVQYTGTGSAATIGHGLGVTPDIIIFKRTNGYNNWDFQYKGELRLTLNLTDAQATNVLCTFTSTTTDLGSVVTNEKNANGGTYSAYCFAEKQGFSKFGKYVGNGNADGPFVYTGFKPAFVMMKRSDAAGASWAIFDNKRSDSGFNVIDKELAANESSAEYDRAAANTDFLSNGFKIRNTDGWHNTSGGTYIYMAFAENPFVTSTGIPTTAR